MRSVILTLFLLVLVPLVRAESTEPTPPAVPQTERGALAEAIQNLLDEEREALAGLRAKMAAETDPLRAEAIQNELGQAKRRTERKLLELQLDHAQKRGDQALTTRLRTAIERLDRPERVDRPVAPKRGEGSR